MPEKQGTEQVDEISRLYRARVIRVGRIEAWQLTSSVQMLKDGKDVGEAYATIEICIPAKEAMTVEVLLCSYGQSAGTHQEGDQPAQQ